MEMFKHSQSSGLGLPMANADRALLWGRQFLNPYAFDDLEGDAAYLTELAMKMRSDGT